MTASCVLVSFVPAQPSIADQQDRILAELAELGLSFARGLEARVGLVQSVEDAQALALAFHRVSRSVRLCVALQGKLARERRHLVREDDILGRRASEARKAQVRVAVTRAVYDEYEHQDPEALLDELDERLDEEALFEAFTAEPLDVCIARIRKDLGLPPSPPANDPAERSAPHLIRSG